MGEQPPGVGGRVLAGVALIPAAGVFALTALLTPFALAPDPDVYLQGHEIPTFVGLALAHLAVVGYAIWGLTGFARGQAAPFWSTAFAYVAGGIATPYLYLLAVRWFSGG